MGMIINILAAIYLQAGPVFLKMSVDKFFQLDFHGWTIIASLCLFQISMTTIPGRIGYFFGLCVLALTSFVTLLNVLSIWIFKSPLSIISLSTTVQSNSHEVGEFLKTYGTHLLMSAGVYVPITILLIWIYRSSLRPKTYRIAISTLILSLLCSAPVLYRSKGNLNQAARDFHELAYVDRLLTSLARYKGITDAREQARALWGNRGDLKKSLNLHALHKEKAAPLVVIVIGESTTRNHMGIYGYHRQTTPVLETMKDQLIVFRDAISPVASTLPGVIGALCSTPLDMNSFGCNGPTLVEIAQAAGYKTTWISNQAPTGFGDNFLVELGKTADASFFVNRDVSSAGEADSSMSFDEKVLGPIEEVVKKSRQGQEKSMIFVHLMGTHFIYEKRYPKDQRTFQSTHDLKIPSQVQNASAKDIINHYDNAVAYQDKVLGQILSHITASETEALFFYFSDHGEEVYDTDNFAGHSEDRVTPSMREIPFIVGYSASYARRHTSELKRIKGYDGRPFSSFQLTPSITGLLGLSYDGFNQRDNVFSDDFASSRELMSAGDGHKATSIP